MCTYSPPPLLAIFFTLLPPPQPCLALGPTVLSAQANSLPLSLSLSLLLSSRRDFRPRESARTRRVGYLGNWPVVFIMREGVLFLCLSFISLFLKKGLLPFYHCFFFFFLILSCSSVWSLVETFLSLFLCFVFGDTQRRIIAGKNSLSAKCVFLR